ncbi:MULTISPECIES: glycoside hydrolase domain-containing protein [Bacillales]|nr:MULTISPECIES: glycoside hydrolase domain-containing protein [Bacillales]
MANSKGIDCAKPLTADKARVMAAAGMKFVCRYLVPASMQWKRLTRAEAEAIKAYLRETAKELMGYVVGVYGSYNVVEEMAKRRACKHFWQTYAWSRGKFSKAANLFQYQNGQTLAGHTVDYNDALGGEGWWNTNPPAVEKPVNKLDKESAEEVIAILGSVWMASDNDPGVREAAHYAANALCDAVGIPR